MTIELAASSMLTAIETTGFFAPLVFILFHLIRQFLLIPVVVVCIGGGIIFGAELGAMYSVIGLTGSSITFYLMAKLFPALMSRFIKMKQKWFGEYTKLSIGQIMILRMIPFVNFSLISLCIIERAKTFQSYTKLSLVTHIPSVLCFTFLGASLQALSPIMLLVIFVVLAFLVYFFREKQVLIKWNDFFVKQKA
ncbi:VTT domain-containing protein [uncultured Metabacillus sp.]|uniref:TVP38/TMEM64 family protein n=1 Tax=uncultured Metabacillus sp. TaxID=2860135 RepID=UPI00262ECDFD|nr:VTT domain-containing protein [uncultured Metabacillus sp.]